MTQIDPSNWNGRSSPMEMHKTWCVQSYDGNMYINGHSTPCDPWKEKFGAKHKLTYEDTVSLTLCDDRSVSITCNDKQVSNVFERLPHGPLRIVLSSPGMEIVQPR